MTLLKNILYTGFKGGYNSSFQLVNELGVNKIFLTNSYGGIERDIADISNKYDKIIMFGLDKNLKDTIRFETIAKRDGILTETKFDFTEYKRAAEKLNIRYTVSNRPTAYLCNYAYFEMMLKADCPVLFVHIPSVKNMSDGFQQRLAEVFNE